MRLHGTLLAVALLALAAGCDEGDGTGGGGAGGEGGEGGGGGVPCIVDSTYDPTIDAASFTTTVTNPYFPLVPGTATTFEGGGEHVEVVVTSSTKTILGVATIEVRDTVTVGGEITEDTLDWFAQDAAGNVWYFGEDTKEYEGGQLVSTEGSWEAGVDGAKPGIVMPANPTPAGLYRQEYYACHAEDEAEVLAVGETATVPAATYTGCVKTHELTRLQPDVNEEKYYCPGVGVVLEVDVDSGARTELTAVTPP